MKKNLTYETINFTIDELYDFTVFFAKLKILVCLAEFRCKLWCSIFLGEKAGFRVLHYTDPFIYKPYWLDMPETEG